jgi:phosphinothricin acetyltransferase
VRLRAATPADAAAIAGIYAPYVTDSIVSFETEPPTPEEVRARIEAAQGLYPWIVAADDDETVAGYAYATSFRARAAYRFTVETSVYLAPAAKRRGLGGRLYQALLATLEAQGFAQAIGVVTLANQASIALHERLGFEAAGVYRDVGWKVGGWHSVGLWQRRLAPATVSPTEPKPVDEVGLRLV